jgi:hypothetical protein
LPERTHTATFRATDGRLRMLADLACPACGHVESRELPDLIAMNRMRIFCDCCGAFVTILLNDEQVKAIRGGSVA